MGVTKDESRDRRGESGTLFPAGRSTRPRLPPAGSAVTRRAGQAQTLSAKIVPPTAPALLLARPHLGERLDEVLQRRLTTIVAEAGFGKSTLLSDWAARVHSAWYTATRDDGSLDTLARGLVNALRLRVPGLPPDLPAVLAGSRGPDSGADEVERAQACAALICQALQEQLRRDLALVVDDFHELVGVGAVRLVDALCREAPPSLHIVLASRLEPPFPIDRLRGQGQVLELGGSDLAFTVAETAELLAEIAGQNEAETAEQVHEATGGWPAAVRLAAETLREVPASGRASALGRIRRSGGPLFAYLAAEVFAHEPPEVTQLVRTVAPLERFTADLCEALGVEGADEILRSLARRGLFVEHYGDAQGWYSLGAAVRDFALSELGLGEAGRRRVHRRVARWLEERGDLDEALRSLTAIGDRARIARLLARHGPTLLARGSVESVVAAIQLLPDELRDERIEQLAGEALQLRGDWDGALRSFERAANGAARLAPGLAWRMALMHQLRGRLVEAFAVYERASIDEGSPRDTALLLAWRASAHWLRGHVAEAEEDAGRAFEIASAAADPQALAAAHTVLAMLAALEGDRGTNDAHYLRALDYAEQAGDLLQLIRVRTNRGSHHLEEGAYEAAIAELDLALRLADIAGFASFKALALTNRGEARRRLGRLEEAVADLEQARELYQRLGSRMIAYPLVKLANVYRERGDTALARAAFEEAVAEAEAAGDLQGLAPALAGLARLLAGEEPEEAERVAERACSFGYGMAQVQALLAAGWVALAHGDRDRAALRAAEAAAAARSRRDRAGLAESLELRALAAPEPATELNWLGEAAALWHELRSPICEAQVELVVALIEGDAERAERVEDRLRALGARGYRTQLSRLLPPAAEPPLVVQTLGRFRLLRDGEPIPPASWQSRKARDLLKILIARRGRPTPREYLMEALWPRQDPTKLGSRLSVLLSTARSVLDPEKRLDPDSFIAADAGAVWLQIENVPVDVERFLTAAADGLALLRAGAPEAAGRLAEAEAAYAGEFLEEDAYEDWAVGLREEARSTYVDVVRALAEDATARGDADAAARFYRRVLERDPYDEPAHLGLVGVLDSAGRHGEARRCFHAYCARMRKIGVESAPFPRAAA
jgi:ATP/maltotriose-dependent transcriptional regulator MalT/DNA-binding SARP family transcriptional activator